MSLSNDLTISTLSFTMRANDLSGGSERREISRGVNLPEIMTIKSQPYVDSVTKLPGRRTVLRFDLYFTGTGGKPIPVSSYLVVAVPNDPAITSANVVSAIARINGVIDNTSPNLDLGSSIFVSQNQ